MNIPPLTYLPIEGYSVRASELMSAEKGWTSRRLGKHFDITRIEPDESQHSAVITSGRVLDSINRPLWALGQIKKVLESVPGGQIYVEDFFHPGIESLPYSGRDYRIYSFCWAQTFDQFDFTREMIRWMRSYEMMMLGFARKTFVASPILQDLILTAVPGLTAEDVPVVGLPFDVEGVKHAFDPEYQPEPVDVVFSSRFDKEKQPTLFLDLVELLAGKYKFAICTGHEELKGNDYVAVARANTLRDRGKLTILSGLTKGEYYSVLKAATVQFNASLQDWVSFTLLEALTFGCVPVYPLYRDFAYVFRSAPEYTYAPNSARAAAEVVEIVMNDESAAKSPALKDILEYHDGTYDRIATQILGDR